MEGQDFEVLIEDRINGISNERVYFTLKTMRIHYISSDQIRAIKIFIALRDLGVSIVPSPTFHYFYGTTNANTLSMLHRLGDKAIITLVRNEKPGALRYTLSDKFVSLWASLPTNLNTRS